ncbi:MAG TPA: hypothetical protein VK700_04130 [Steroidobacteraceae bacterium]|jgi:hypothetical protein|nr:hypothetical protein [Steroidobacteraceae bacterium]
MNRVATTLAGASLLLLSQLASAAVPEGWFANGSALNDFTVVTDRAVLYQGHPSVSISSKKMEKTDSNGFAGLMQQSSANDYQGKRVRLSAYLRTRDVVGERTLGAHIWFRVDGPGGKMLGFDNMDTRPVKGNTEWTQYAIVLDVPRESIGLAYGFFLNAAGTVWATGFKLEEVSNAVPATNSLPLHPANLDFEQ